MKTHAELILPAELRYTSEHVWVALKGDEAVVGITDFAQDQLGEVAFVDLPGVGSSFEAGAEFGTVESMKSVSPLYMPVNGEVTEINEELSSTPTLVNVNSYVDGWMIKIRCTDPAQVEKLLDSKAYLATLA